MALSPSSSPSARCLAAILVLLLVSAGAAHAKKEEKEEEKRQFTVTEPVGKKLLKAQEAMAEEQWDLAIESLESLERKADKGRLGDHERFNTIRTCRSHGRGRVSITTTMSLPVRCMRGVKKR